MRRHRLTRLTPSHSCAEPFQQGGRAGSRTRVRMACYVCQGWLLCLSELQGVHPCTCWQTTCFVGAQRRMKAAGLHQVLRSNVSEKEAILASATNSEVQGSTVQTKRECVSVSA
mmetsp:Transcript_56760/g.116231  ORF Transcript_56760/g.116231 Transcript_56760/m.116231 type:complete len:114 (-) Transcript_56760:38-379(-)